MTIQAMIDAVEQSPLASVPAMIVLKRTGKLKCRRRRSRHAALMTVRFEARSKSRAGTGSARRMFREPRDRRRHSRAHRTSGGCASPAISPVSRRSRSSKWSKCLGDGMDFEMDEQATGERPDVHFGDAVRTGELGFGTGRGRNCWSVSATEANATGQEAQNLPRGKQ